MSDRIEPAARLSRRGFLGGGAAAVSAVAVAGCAATPRASAAAPRLPVPSMTGLLAEPLGVGSATPRLWWQVPVAGGPAGGLQESYELQLTTDPRGFVRKAPVTSTGRVRSSSSTAVAWPFADLDPVSLAWWRVRVWTGPQGAKVSGWSRPQRVVTGPDGDWRGAVGIWAPPVAPPAGDVTVRARMAIKENRAGVLLRTSDDLRQGYLWQVTAATAGTGSLLRPHALVDGAYALLAEVPLPSPLAVGQVFDLVVDVRGSTITTSVDGVRVDSRTDARHARGRLGVRTGLTETFWVDSASVTDAAGAELWSSTFDAPGDVPSFASHDAGRMLVGKGTSGLIEGAGPDHWALLRRAFTLPPSPVTGAFWHVAALSPDGAKQFVYRAWCNDTHVGTGPVRSADGPRYETHDVTSLVRAGEENVLALQCWAASGKQVQALLVVHHRDGTTTTVGSDGGWQARTGGRWLPWAGDFSTSYYSAPDEAYDARFEPVGWRAAGFAGGHGFVPALAGTALRGLRPSAVVNPARRVLTPASVTSPSAGRRLVDAGAELVGGLRVTVDVPAALAGTVVTVRLGEELNPDGTVRFQLRAQTTYEERWTLRAGPQVIEHWGYRGFRYAELLADAALRPEVTLLEHAAPEPAVDPLTGAAASFSSSDPNLDAVWALCARTVRGNRVDLMQDCPTRERGPYEGDLLAQARSQMALAPSYDLGRATVRYLTRRPTWPTEYRFMSAVAAWEEYLETGDPDALDADFALLAALQADARGWLSATSGLVDKDPGSSSADGGDLVDWPLSQRDGYVFGRVNTVVNAWQHASYAALAAAASVTGRTAEATRLSGLAAALRSALHAATYVPGTGAYLDGPATSHSAQHAAAAAVACGVTPAAALPAVGAWLTADAANPVRVSSNAAAWLLEALYRSGRAAEALDVLRSERDASWMAMIEQWGATMTMEAWSPTVKSNTTFNHAWSAGPVSVIARRLLGVRVVEAGAARIVVEPQPASLAWARGTVATVRGPVGVDVRQAPLSVAVTVPGNVVGTLRWPAGSMTIRDVVVRGPKGSKPVARLAGGVLEVDLVPGQTVLAGR